MDQPLMVTRSPMDIVCEILSLCRHTPAGSAVIVHGASLQYDDLLRYLEFLVRRGLLSRDGEGLFLATDEGKEFLEEASGLVRFLAKLDWEGPSGGAVGVDGGRVWPLAVAEGDARGC